MKIIVLAGGLSDERDVSFSSGSLISNALIENGHEVMLMDLYLGDKNPEFPLVYHSKEDNYQYHYVVPASEPDLEYIKSLKGDNNLIANNLIDYCKEADFVFLALHGSIGEDGTIQELLDKHNIKYSGSSPSGCKLAMDKELSKELVWENGINTPKWWTLNVDLDSVEFPCVVKPCSSGSSVGISMVDNKQQLSDAIEIAKKYEDKVLIEKRIIGREVTVGILNGKVLPIIEIIPKKGFYNYENKYQNGLTEEICPAPITKEIEQKIIDSALKAHKVLKLGCYSRLDYMLDENNEIYFLEANSLPGMTPTSLLPLAAKKADISYNELCEIIINSSLNK